MRRDALLFLSGTLLTLLGTPDVRAYPTEDQQDALTTTTPIIVNLDGMDLCHFKICNMQNEPQAKSDSSASSSEERNQVDEHASKDTHEDGVIVETEKEEDFQRVKRASRKKDDKDDKDDSSSSSSSSSSDDDDDDDDNDNDNDDNNHQKKRNSKKRGKDDDDDNCDDDDDDDDNNDDDDDSSSSSSSSSEEDKKRNKRDIKEERFIRGLPNTHLSEEKSNPTNGHIDEVKVGSESKSSSKEKDKSTTPKLIRIPLYRSFTLLKSPVRTLQDTSDKSKSSSEEIHTPKNRFTRALEDTSEESKSSSEKERGEPKTRLVRSTEDSTSKLSSEKSDKVFFLIPPHIEDVSRSHSIVKQTDKPHNRVTRSKDGKKKKREQKKKTKRHCTPKATTVKADTPDETVLPASHLPV